ncbi:MAG TPA: (2Fe-2S)-binding protein [Acetobacteraceae bacterium]|nr:(2Fe-2S)-binding protein [Acetobacteraceae bacterium]
MFRRVDEAGAVLRLEFEGEAVLAREGDSVAAALLAAGARAFRDTAISASPRGPYCMMGVCFECLVEIDGIANRQACMVPAADGMKIRRQRGAREAA